MTAIYLLQNIKMQQIQQLYNQQWFDTMYAAVEKHIITEHLFTIIRKIVITPLNLRSVNVWKNRVRILQNYLLCSKIC